MALVSESPEPSEGAEEATASSRSSGASRGRSPLVRTGVAVLVAVMAGAIAWLVLRDTGSSSSTTRNASRASGISRSGLVHLAVLVRHPVFWLGPKKGYTLELTRTANGKIYVRYLPSGVSPGANKPYLTVATYPFPGAFTAIKKQASARGAVTTRLAHGGLAVLDQHYPESVHLAYPGVNYQVEVFDPTPARAMSLVVGRPGRDPRQARRDAARRPRPVPAQMRPGCRPRRPRRS